MKLSAYLARLESHTDFIIYSVRYSANCLRRQIIFIEFIEGFLIFWSSIDFSESSIKHYHWELWISLFRRTAVEIRIKYREYHKGREYFHDSSEVASWIPLVDSENA